VSPGVRDIHDTHLWSLDGEHHILTAHIVVETSGYDAMREIKCRVKEAAAGLGISHATIEVECEGEECPVAEAY
jgi:cobalt-zinc-cadmium efflux system protein